MKLILFLGAGVSVPSGLETVDRLTRKILRSTYHQNIDRTFSPGPKQTRRCDSQTSRCAFGHFCDVSAGMTNAAARTLYIAVARRLMRTSSLCVKNCGFGTSGRLITRSLRHSWSRLRVLHAHY